MVIFQKFVLETLLLQQFNYDSNRNLRLAFVISCTSAADKVSTVLFIHWTIYINLFFTEQVDQIIELSSGKDYNPMAGYSFMALIYGLPVC